MKISIVTPTFNSAKTILDTCISVTSQDYLNFEHIIIDNLSSDETLTIIKNHYAALGMLDKLYIYSEKDKGISDAFNKGVSKSTGEIVAILNSDDYYLTKDLFSQVINVFSSTPAQVFHGDMYFEDNDHGSNTRAPLLCKIEEGMPVNHPTCFIKKEIYEEFGLFKLEYRYAMDYEWFSRFYLGPSDSRFYYFKNSQITFMRGAGVSANFEMKSLEEIKRALIQNNLWNSNAQKKLQQRILRVRIKSILNNLHITWPVWIWRKLKWKN